MNIIIMIYKTQKDMNGLMFHSNGNNNKQEAGNGIHTKENMVRNKFFQNKCHHIVNFTELIYFKNFRF